MTITKHILPLALLLTLAACGGGNRGGNGGEEETDLLDAINPVAEEAQPIENEDLSELHPFPLTSVPMIYSGDSDAEAEYVINHYWDNFFNGSGPTGPSSILGVSDDDVEQALANYIAFLQDRKALATPDNITPLTKAQKGIKALFSKLEQCQNANPGSHVYVKMTDLVSTYLYDPNSPVRDEDLYLPFAEAAEKSSCTSEDMRAAYKYEASQCRINGFGQTVPDIKYCDIRGHKGNLYSVKADYTMLFFSNPGCTACKEIVNEVLSRGYTDRLISQGKLAIVNIYIDEEVSKWRDYVPNYPSSWINGYDYTFKLRTSGAFDIRAIPSLYLLDSHKRVLMKDAPTESVLSYLDRI